VGMCAEGYHIPDALEFKDVVKYLNSNKENLSTQINLLGNNYWSSTE
jgi:hypothetical protein